MRTLTISVILIAAKASDVPDYAAVGGYKCETGIWHFATSYHSYNGDRAIEDCQRADCDIVIEWTRQVGRKLYTIYDIGKFAQQTCKQGSVDSAKIIWPKSEDRFINELNSTTPGFSKIK